VLAIIEFLPEADVVPFLAKGKTSVSVLAFLSTVASNIATLLKKSEKVNGEIFGMEPLNHASD
jgi:hypothetical protein